MASAQKSMFSVMWLPLAFVFAGVMCFVGVGLIGSHVDEQGILREPFFLIPTGYLLILIGLSIALVRSILIAWRWFAGQGQRTGT